MTLLSDDFIDEALVRFARGTRKDFARYIEEVVTDRIRKNTPEKMFEMWENVFIGPPPVGHKTWKGFFQEAWSHNPFCLRGLRISALRKPHAKNVLDMTPQELHHEYLEAGQDYDMAITLLRNDTKQATLELMSGTK